MNCLQGRKDGFSHISQTIVEAHLCDDLVLAGNVIDPSSNMSANHFYFGFTCSHCLPNDKSPSQRFSVHHIYPCQRTERKPACRPPI